MGQSIDETKLDRRLLKLAIDNQGEWTSFGR